MTRGCHRNKRRHERLFSTHLVGDKMPDAVEPAVDALNRLNVPLKHGLRRGFKQREDLKPQFRRNNQKYANQHAASSSVM